MQYKKPLLNKRSGFFIAFYFMAQFA